MSARTIVYKGLLIAPQIQTRTLEPEHAEEIFRWYQHYRDVDGAARVVTLARGDRASAHLATLLLMTYPGAVSVYYGDELGLPGGLPATITT